ncbi:hypothetical protein [Dehalobacterium formicoaceticum]|uniref:hypothetical protein n=1 Tax=Dehalobacterium formicoaceticum TaxID=51515 RepID=UPI000B7D8A7F|nr:hypothetical protein [Dehalobacterium formicoaceticum]
MSATHTFSLFLPAPEKIISATLLLMKIRSQVEEIKITHPELKNSRLINVGMYRAKGGIRVKLYFSQGEEQALATEKRAEF